MKLLCKNTKKKTQLNVSAFRSDELERKPKQLVVYMYHSSKSHLRPMPSSAIGYTQCNLAYRQRDHDAAKLTGWRTANKMQGICICISDVQADSLVQKIHTKSNLEYSNSI